MTMLVSWLLLVAIVAAWLVCFYPEGAIAYVREELRLSRLDTWAGEDMTVAAAEEASE